MPHSPLRPILLAGALMLSAGPAAAQPYGGWGGSPWGQDRDRVPTQGNAEPSRQIEVETYRAADAGDRLGKGRIVVSEPPAPPAPPPPPPSDGLPGTGAPPDAADKLPVYEAAVVDQLAAKGYDIAHVDNPAQLVEVSVSHAVVIPEEARHKPVSGEMAVGVSNYGASYGLALNVDLSKPRKAIVATRVDVRIRDKATSRVLWEGHAEGQTRATEDGYNDGPTATRLANALFAKFPAGKIVQPDAGAQHLGPVEGGGE
jgi:hypothetical protein